MSRGRKNIGKHHRNESRIEAKQDRDCNYDDAVHTNTLDNGTEFHAYPPFEPTIGSRCYFATPHHSWEHGTNENANG